MHTNLSAAARLKVFTEDHVRARVLGLVGVLLDVLRAHARLTYFRKIPGHIVNEIVRLSSSNVLQQEPIDPGIQVSWGLRG
jgi:hypothetical protein